ncbi:unnamed protein product [Lactuca virosa]|uniref:TF-B3 domain-containing protein n=1 Tax=Lactuca virosa TaxID=75947 RepID=A0AAU9NWY7_9ASTR|nr:unnamed protein product [Lactuca virosa]
MARPPTHFFKFVPPGFLLNLSIPSSFLTNLNGKRCSEAILRRGRHEWSVDIDDGVFGDGWMRFVRENGVQEFDFIVFKNQGCMVFDVMVFEQSTCEKHYPNLFDKMEGEEPLTESETIRTHRPKKVKKRKRNDYAYEDEEIPQVGSGCFIGKMTPYVINKSRLYLPVDFWIPNRLKAGEMILRNNKGRSWKVELKKANERLLYLGSGFTAFLVANGMEEGDAFKFELAEKEEDKPPIVNFMLSAKQVCKVEWINQSQRDDSQKC